MTSYLETSPQTYVFDLDDTLCSTRHLFTDALKNVAAILSAQANLPLESALLKIEQINNALFETHSVNPIRWQHVYSALLQSYPQLAGYHSEILSIFGQIYTTPLVLRSDARSLFTHLSKQQRKICIVTHANLAWTEKKYHWLGLDQFLPRKNLYVIDENGHKTTEAWQAAFIHLGLEPSKCVVVGDSPRSDILPCHTLGVEHLYLFEDPNQWSIHRQPLPPYIRRIKSLEELVNK